MCINIYDRVRVPFSSGGSAGVKQISRRDRRDPYNKRRHSCCSPSLWSLGVAGVFWMAEKVTQEKGKGTDKDDEGGMSSLEKHLEGMKLQGEEEDDLDFSGEFEELVKEVR